MKKMIFALLLCFLLPAVEEGFAQEMRFFEGGVEAAGKEGKPVLLYFRLEGTEPCVDFEKNVLGNEVLGKFFNERFVNCRIEADKRNKSLIEKYQVKAVPVVVLLDAQGKEAYRMEGDISVNGLLHIGKVMTGDALSLEKLFEAAKSGNYSLESLQTLLYEALAFLPVLNEEEMNRWTGEIQAMYNKYLEVKPMDQMVNIKDFTILTSYLGEVAVGDLVFEFISENYDGYKEIVPEKDLANFLLDRHTELINTLARSGNVAYLDELARIKGDLAKVYNQVKSPVSVDSLLRYQADADYSLYGLGDQDAYVDFQNKYFEFLGTHLSWNDMYDATNKLVKVANGKYTDKALNVCLVWVDVIAQQKGIADGVKIWCYVTLGDCYSSIDDKQKAKGFYNQAYLLSVQENNEQLQHFLKQKIATLGV